MLITTQTNGYFKITDNNGSNLRFIDSHNAEHNDCDKIMMPRWGKNAYSVIELYRYIKIENVKIECEENGAGIISALNDYARALQ